MKCLIIDAVHSAIAEELGKYMQVDTHMLPTQEELVKLIQEDAEKGRQFIDLVLVAKYFERIGDHAVNIAEWVIFSITGRHKNQRII